MNRHFISPLLFFIVAGLLTLVVAPARAQDAYADSLKTVLSANIHDTVRVNTLIALSTNFLGTDLTLAMQYANAAKAEAKKAQFGKGLGYAYKYTGIVYYMKSQFVEALDEWQHSLSIFDSIGEKRGQANILSNIGAVYFDQGENTRALENYLQSLRISQQLNDKLRIATAMINIGAVYFDKPATHELALEYYLQALDISEEIKDTRAIGTVCVNIGEIYLTRKDDQRAQQYFQKSLDYGKGSDIEASALLGMASVYNYRKDFRRALEFQRQAFENAKANDNLLDAARALVAQAVTLKEMNDKGAAVEKYKSALPLAKTVGANKELKDIYQGLSSLYASALRFDSAYKYQELFGNYKDTLFNIAADKKLTVLRLDFELEKKESQITQLTVEKELKDGIIKRQNIIRNLIIAGLASVMIFLYIALKQKRRIAKEKQRSEELLLNILPYEIAEELKEKGISDARHFSQVTVLFTDFVGFTGVSQQMSAQNLVFELNKYFKAFDEIITKYQIEKIKTIGDAYMAAGGVPKEDGHSVANVILAALEMQDFVKACQKEGESSGAHTFGMRLGIHTGPVVAGIVGVKKFQYDIWGDTVNTASRMESNGENGKVNISEDTYEAIKHLEIFSFEKREKAYVKGKGEMQMYFVWRKE